MKRKFLQIIAVFTMVAAAFTASLPSLITPAHAATTILSENFETGAPGWTTTGFWHIQDHPETISVLNPAINPSLVTLPDSGQLPAAFSGTHVAWFGAADTGTYCDTFAAFNPSQPAKNGCTSSSPHSGELTSPIFSLAGASSAAVQFQAWWEIESVTPSSFDIMQVDYSIDGGATWVQAGKLNPTSNPAGGASDKDFTNNGLEQPAQWKPYNFDISGAAGHSSVQIRFLFNTFDTLFNGFRGWLVDDVQVVANIAPTSQTHVVTINGTSAENKTHHDTFTAKVTSIVG